MRIKVPFLILGLVALGFVTQAYAICDQIAPNPNPVGATITNTSANGCNELVPFENSGTLNNNGTLNNDGQLINTNFGGVLNNNGMLNNYGSLQFLGMAGALNNTGTLNNYGGLNSMFPLIDNSGTLNNYGSIFAIHLGVINTGTLNNYNSVFFEGLVNHGVMNNEVGSRMIVEISSTNNSGTLNNRGQARSHDLFNTGTLNNYGEYLLAFGGSNRGMLNNSGMLSNNGQIDNSGQFVSTGAITGIGTYTQTAGTTVINGTMAQGAVNINGGVLQGVGSITAVTVNGGTIAPGNSPGILTINGNYTQSAMGSFAAEIGGRVAGTEYDLLRVLGIATLDGTLQVSLLDLGDGLFSPHLGDTFDILRAEQIVGSFSSLLLPDLRRGYAQQLVWEVDYLADAFGTTDVVRLHVAAVPEPEIYAMMMVGVGVLSFVARRKKKLQAAAA